MGGCARKTFRSRVKRHELIKGCRLDLVLIVAQRTP